ncbi:MAG: aminoacetone oxidase family FAD-binding enzyme, partial [Victivallales bacterium]
ALNAARQGHRVKVLERQERPGLKLLASGGGRCNITNVLNAEQLSAAFGRQGRFTLPALKLLPPEKLRAFLAENGVETKVTDGFHVFPKSDKARDILNVLLRLCAKLGVQIKTSCQVEKLIITENRLRGVQTSAGDFPADCVIIAGGGKGYPRLGGDGSAYQLAEQAGHKINTPLPALVGLRCAEEWPGRCTGISFKKVNAKIDLPKYRGNICRGELLFTHHGVSGPAVLDLAGTVSSLLTGIREVPLTISLFPETDIEKWQDILKEQQVSSGKKQISGILSQYLPKAPAKEFCALAGIQADMKIAELKAEYRNKLCSLLTAFTLKVKSTDGWDKAMLTHGGVELKKVNPNTLESRLLKGLFFAGEVLDLQGPCGGYNLQWAFAGGKLAGSSV